MVTLSSTFTVDQPSHIIFIYFFMPCDKICKHVQVDCLVCAKFSYENEDPLFIFKNIWSMIHGPCTPRRCLDKDDQCFKHHPIFIQEYISMDTKGYPLYPCHNDKWSFEKHDFFFYNSLILLSSLIIHTWSANVIVTLIFRFAHLCALWNIFLHTCAKAMIEK